MCLIDNFNPSSARVFEVDRSYRFKKGSGMPVRIPVIELVEIGAGGGSIAHIDSLKRIEIGPESAGAEPGPACYGRGGVRPAVTDADFLLGRIIPENFAGGSIALDEVAAQDAMTRYIGAPLGLDCEAAAFGVGEMVDESMAAAARAHAVEQGKDIRRRAMIAFGGAAPIHAARLAEKLGLDRVIVPEGAGVGSAIGFLLAPASYEIVRSLPMRLDALDENRVAALFAELRVEAESVVRAAEPLAPLVEKCAAYMRYVGQGYEIAVLLPAPPQAGKENLAAGIKAEFEKSYRKLYGRSIPGMTVEVLSWSLRISAPSLQVEAVSDTKAQRDARANGARAVFDASESKRLSYGVHHRTALKIGDRVAGPALIVEAQTTTVVTSRFDAYIDPARNIVLLRKARA